MKTLLETKKLLKLLQNAQGYIVPKKSTVPIIQNVNIKVVDEKKIAIIATDLENSLVQILMADSTEFVKNKGFCVDAKILIGLLSKLGSATVMFEYQATSVKITAENNTYSIPYLDGKDFPTIMEVDQAKAQQFELQTAVFKNYMQKALPFIGTDENRPVITTIHVMIADKKITIEATDAIKILRAEDTIETESVVDINIPNKFAVTFNKIYELETVVICADEKRIEAMGENFKLSCRLVEGRYPNTKPLFESPRDKKLTFKKELLLPAIERLLLFSNHVSTAIKFNVNYDHVLLESADNDLGLSGKERVTADFNSHDPFQIGIAGKHLEACINAFRQEELTICFGSEKETLKFEDSLHAVNVLLAPIMI